MEKTKLGISVALAAAALYFLGLFGGYIITGIAVGYVLLREESLKKIEGHMEAIVQLGRSCNLSKAELLDMLKFILDEQP